MRKGIRNNNNTNLLPSGKPQGMILNNKKRAADEPSHDGGGSSKKERTKNTFTVSARMRQVVDQMLVCDDGSYALALQQTTIFAFKSHQSEIISCFLQDIRRENPTLYQNKEMLLQIVSEAYDEAKSMVY